MVRRKRKVKKRQKPTKKWGIIGAPGSAKRSVHMTKIAKKKRGGKKKAKGRKGKK